MKKSIEEQLEKFKHIKNGYMLGSLKSKNIFGYYYGKPITDPNEYREILNKLWNEGKTKEYCDMSRIGYWESIGEQH